MMKKAKQDEGLHKTFSLKSFFDELNSIGGIPIALGTWEMTGEKPDFLDVVEKTARSKSKFNAM